jgi:molecular chaperone DnaK
MSKILGIDLGTTNSCMAIMEGGEPVVIPNAEGARTTPSVVAFTKTGERVVGQAAKRQAVTNPKNTVFSAKRFIGRKFSEVKAEAANMPFKVVEGKNGDAYIEVQVGDKTETFAPQQIAAFVLAKLKADAEAYLGEKITQTVITVPAYFNDAQRQATKDAGRIAGLEVLRIVNEPTAASLAYGLQKMAQGVIAVYDLGGGTFDISILRVKDGVFEVLATNGNTHLGGDDFDRAMVDWLLADIQARHGVDLSGDAEAMQELRLGAEAAKCRLSFDQRTVLTIPFERFAYHRDITRHDLEAMVEPLVAATLGPCRQALTDAALGTDQVDEVVLVGGSTRMPLVQRRVAELFGRPAHSRLNPDEVVALGAAVQAQILAGGITDMLLLDVTPLSLGIETLGGIVSVLIPRNTTIPTLAKEYFTTSVDGQTAVDLHVLQGERELAKDNRSLARFDLAGVDPMPAGMPKIEVTFLIDANGILQVQARELRTGKAASIEVKPTYGLTETQVEQMVEDSYTYAEDDVNARLLIETQTEADTVINHVERALRQAGGIATAEERTRIEAAMALLRTTRAGTDRDQIRERTIELNQATAPLADRLMEAAIKDAVTSKRADRLLENS